MQAGDDPRPSLPAEPLYMVEMVFPNTTNHYGTMFGGKVVDLMDRAAFLASTRFSSKPMVTASIEHIDFFVPVKQGNLVELVARVVHSGRTSLTVRVDLFSEDPMSRTRDRACEGYFHMVAVDAAGKPVVVPRLLLRTDEERGERERAERLYRNRSARRSAGVAG